MSELTEWLLAGPAWVQYRTRVDLLKQKEDHPQAIAARKAMLADPQIKATIRAASELSTTVVNSHKSAGHLSNNPQLPSAAGRQPAQFSDGHAGSGRRVIQQHASRTIPADGHLVHPSA